MESNFTFLRERFPVLARFGERPLLMTEKDAVKCRAFAPAHWWYLPVSAELPASLLDTLLQRLTPLQAPGPDHAH